MMTTTTTMRLAPSTHVTLFPSNCLNKQQQSLQFYSTSSRPQKTKKKKKKEEEEEALLLRQQHQQPNDNNEKKKMRRRTAAGVLVPNTVMLLLLQNQLANAVGLDLDEMTRPTVEEAKRGLLQNQLANVVGLDLDEMTRPTVEEAKRGIRGHAESLLQVKTLLEEESWRAAQKLLRKSSSNLKIDLYAIIQNKPPAQRPRLRTLYSNLFNIVTKLDYAAREKDAPVVRRWYESMVAALDEVLSAI